MNCSCLSICIKRKWLYLSLWVEPRTAGLANWYSKSGDGRGKTTAWFKKDSYWSQGLYRIQMGIILCVWVCCTTCMLSTGWSQKRVSETLELDPEMSWAALWVVEIKPRYSGRAANAPNTELALQSCPMALIVTHLYLKEDTWVVACEVLRKERDI